MSKPKTRTLGAVLYEDFELLDLYGPLEMFGSIGAELRIVTVAEPVPEPASGGAARRAHGPDGDVEAYLAALVRRVSRTGGPRIEGVVVDDPIGAAPGLRSWLPDHPAQLLVATTHARTGVHRVLAGSTAAHIVHSSPVPVLLVPPPS